MVKRSKKVSSDIQIGIWRHHRQLDAVWFDKLNRVHYLSSDTEHPLDIPRRISEQLQTDSTNLFKFRFITAIEAHRIWYKTLILPHQLNEAECRQQCLFVLQKELPVPLAELWFDYCAVSLKQGLRLDIFAILQKIARPHLDALLPLHIEVLDNAAHCILRAFNYLLPPKEQRSTLFLYQNEQGCLALQNKSHQLQLLHKTVQNPTALVQQYCEHYAESPEQVMFYSTYESDQPLPTEWQIVHTELPFIALGAALWQKDLAQDECN